MGLQVGTLVACVAIAIGVGLVEGVSLGFLDPAEDLLGLLLGDHALLLGPLDEQPLALGHFLGEFLADGLAERIRLHRVEAGHLDRDEHGLFLVDQHAVGRGQDLLQARMEDLRFLLLVLATAVVLCHGDALLVDRPEAARSEQGTESTDVFEMLWLQFLGPLPAQWRLKLEDALGESLANQVPRGGTVGRCLLDVEVEQGDHAGRRILFEDRPLATTGETVDFSHISCSERATPEPFERIGGWSSSFPRKIHSGMRGLPRTS